MAAALIFIFYRLARHPDWAEKLYTELTTCQTLHSTTLQSLPLLNAFINETFRLHPPVPSAGLRDTPPEGITIGDQYIPGGVTVLTPNYSLGRRKPVVPFEVRRSLTDFEFAQWNLAMNMLTSFCRSDGAQIST